jgi:hypothetical protein
MLFLVYSAGRRRSLIHSIYVQRFHWIKPWGLGYPLKGNRRALISSRMHRVLLQLPSLSIHWGGPSIVRHSSVFGVQDKDPTWHLLVKCIMVLRAMLSRMLQRCMHWQMQNIRCCPTTTSRNFSETPLCSRQP